VSVGLSVGTISQTNSATVDAGFVLGQNPSAGESVPPATPIALLISTGPSVPDVVSLSQAAATNAILIAGLSVGSISNAPDGIIPAGSVISQNPTAGTSAAIGSPVDLVVSSGVTVPVLSGAAYQDGVFQLSVSTLSGRHYILEFTDELPATNWMDVQSVSGDNTLRFLTDASATNYQRNYRVRVE
jgi:serine/threonine-protein kinase